MASASDEATACAYTDYEDGEAPEEYPKTGDDADGVEADIWEALYEVEDPEMPVSIVNLGLIYSVEVEDIDATEAGAAGEDDAAGTGAGGEDDAAGAGAAGEDDADGDVRAVVEMTLTYSGCPARDMLQNDVRCAALSAGVDDVDVRLRYSPTWNVKMVTEAGREDLREFGLSV